MGHDALENTCFDDRTHDGVHASAVAAGGENCEFHCDVLWYLPPHKELYTYRRKTGVGVGNYGMDLLVRKEWGERLDKIQDKRPTEGSRKKSVSAWLRVLARVNYITLGEHVSRRGPDATRHLSL
jgi:hypothetical protein